MGRSRYTPEDRTARRWKTMVIVAVVLALVGWMVAVVALGGGGDEEGSVPGNEGNRQDQADTSSPGQDRDNRADETASENAPGDGDQDGREGSSEDSPEGGDEDEQDSPTSDLEPAAGLSEEQKKAPVRSHTDETITVSPEKAEKLNRPSNPLLRDNPKLSDLSDTDRQRMELAVAKFVSAAYGYSGDSEDDYREGVAATSHTIDLYNSPGGKRIDQEYAKAIGEEGIEAAAKLKQFEVTSLKDQQAQGTAYFTISTGGEYNRYGELEGGESVDYRQDIMLYPYGEVYRVTTVSVEELVQDQKTIDQQREQGEERRS